VKNRLGTEKEKGGEKKNETKKSEPPLSYAGDKKDKKREKNN